MRIPRPLAIIASCLMTMLLLLPAGTAIETESGDAVARAAEATCLGVNGNEIQMIPIGVGHNPADLAPCPGIRPGGALILRAGSFELLYCTMGFIVSDGTDLYVSTAGHCVDPRLGVPGPGERVSAHGVPGQFGTVSYQWCEGGDALGNGCAAGTDFALIKIDADKRSYVNPAMCHWGAPSGTFTAKDQTIRELRQFGWGYGYGNLGGIGYNGGGITVQPANPATQARSHLGLDFSPNSYVFGYGPALSGDSGSGVLVTEVPSLPTLGQPAPQALGILTHIAVGGFIIVQRMDTSLAKAGTETNKNYTVVSSL